MGYKKEIRQKFKDFKWASFYLSKIIDWYSIKLFLNTIIYYC